MPAFAATDCRLYIGTAVPPQGDSDFDGQEWTEIARVETLGSTRIAGGLEVVARQDDADMGQGLLRAAAVSRGARAFRVTFADGSERRFAARIVSARERPVGGRVRAVLAISSEVMRHQASEQVAVAS